MLLEKQIGRFVGGKKTIFANRLKRVWPIEIALGGFGNALGWQFILVNIFVDEKCFVDEKHVVDDKWFVDENVSSTKHVSLTESFSSTKAFSSTKIVSSTQHSHALL